MRNGVTAQSVTPFVFQHLHAIAESLELSPRGK
jgi:hypothetical protein